MNLTGVYRSLNKGEYEMRWQVFCTEPVGIFDFYNDPENPLTLHDGDSWYRPGDFTKFDFGSVPTSLQGVVSPICAPRGFAIHDHGYQFHGLHTPTGFKLMERKEVDDALFEAMRAEGCSKYLANKTWLAVRAAGGSMWDSHIITKNVATYARLHHIRSLHVLGAAFGGPDPSLVALVKRHKKGLLGV